jgi:hypothetical protein
VCFPGAGRRSQSLPEKTFELDFERGQEFAGKQGGKVKGSIILTREAISTRSTGRKTPDIFRGSESDSY